MTEWFVLRSCSLALFESGPAGLQPLRRGAGVLDAAGGVGARGGGGAARRWGDREDDDRRGVFQGELAEALYSARRVDHAELVLAVGKVRRGRQGGVLGSRVPSLSPTTVAAIRGGAQVLCRRWQPLQQRACG